MSDDFTDAEWAEWEREQNAERLIRDFVSHIPGAYTDPDVEVDLDVEIDALFAIATPAAVKAAYLAQVRDRHEMIAQREKVKTQAVRQSPRTAWHRVRDDEKTYCGKFHQEWEAGEWFPHDGKVCENCGKYR